MDQPDHDLLVRCDEKLNIFIRTLTDNEARVEKIESDHRISVDKIEKDHKKVTEELSARLHKLEIRMAMAAGALLVIQYVMTHLWK